MTNDRAVIALDIGGAKISAGLISRAGEALWQRAEATGQISLADSLAQITRLIQDAASASPSGCDVAGVGLAVPGWVNRRAGTVWAPNIAGWDHIPLAREMQQRLSWPLTVDSSQRLRAGGSVARPGTAFSVIFVVALSGGMTAPWLVGNIAQTSSIEAGLGVVIFNCAMIFLLQTVIAMRRARPMPDTT